MARALKPGDKVEWDSSGGHSTGKVVKKETGTTRAGGHIAKSSRAKPQYRVKSDRSGKEAVHRPESLKRKF